MFMEQVRYYIYGLMELINKRTISEIVKNNYRTADVFKKHRINYCCAGSVTLAGACDNLGTNAALIANEVAEASIDLHGPAVALVREWKLDFLIEYIKNVHHRYLQVQLPLLGQQLVSFAGSHARKMPWINELLDTFNTLSVLLLEQDRQQELRVFPYLRQLESAVTGDPDYGRLFIKTFRQPSGFFGQTEDQVANLFTQMRTLTADYSIPGNACVNHQVVLHKLNELDDNCQAHYYLENAILLPRALVMEAQLPGSSRQPGSNRDIPESPGTSGN